LKERDSIPEEDMVTWVRVDRNKAIATLYHKYRGEFLLFSRRYGMGEADILDAFQEAIIAFYEYCKSGKYDQTRSSPKTMIFNMGKYALINMKKKQSRMVSVDDLGLTPLERKCVEIVIDEGLTTRQSQLKEGLVHLSEQCQRIIRLFYYDEYSIQAIVDELGYQNENVVRSQKSRCLKRLREYIKSDFSGTE